MSKLMEVIVSSTKESQVRERVQNRARYLEVWRPVGVGVHQPRGGVAEGHEQAELGVEQRRAHQREPLAPHAAPVHSCRRNGRIISRSGIWHVLQIDFILRLLGKWLIKHESENVITVVLKCVTKKCTKILL